MAMLGKKSTALISLIETWDERGIALDDAGGGGKVFRHGFVIKELASMLLMPAFLA